MAGWFTGILDVVLPAGCVGCGASGGWWCTGCDSRVVRDGRLTRSDGTLTGVVTGAYFREPLPRAIKALKYRHTKAIAGDLAGYLVDPLRTIPAPDAALVPIPLHPRRLRKRGFNQAALLARELGRRTERSVRPGLRRVRNTPTQTDLHRSERFANVAGAFAWRGAPAPKTIILIDDVLTTGATLEAAAGACRAAGTTAVWGLTVARRE